MFDRIFNLFSHDLAIDLGTANTLVLVKGEGIKIAEPSVIALNKKTGKIIAVGRKAEPMLGKTPPDIIAVRPLKEGVISDFEATVKMLEHYIKKLHKDSLSQIIGPRPKVVVGIPSSITEVERRAVVKTVRQAKARQCFLVDEPMAAAIGAGLEVTPPTGNLIADIGGGTSEVALISLSGIVTGISLRKAGESMDQNIIDFVKKEKGLIIGPKTAERCKIEIGSALVEAENRGEKKTTGEVRGREMASGLPRAVTLSSGEIALAVSPTLQAIINTIKEVLEESPPELVSDVQKKGLTLAGGGCLLSDIDTLFSKELGIKVARAKDPQTCVVRGCGFLLDNKELLDRVSYHD
ncbi:MAG: rod shape-determining protein [bacterium]